MYRKVLSIVEAPTDTSIHGCIIPTLSRESFTPPSVRRAYYSFLAKKIGGIANVNLKKILKNGLQIPNRHFKVGTFDLHLSRGEGVGEGMVLINKLNTFEKKGCITDLKFVVRRFYPLAALSSQSRSEAEQSKTR
jgi:hypothetical protein